VERDERRRDNSGEAGGELHELNKEWERLPFFISLHIAIDESIVRR